MSGSHPERVVSFQAPEDRVVRILAAIERLRRSPLFRFIPRDVRLIIGEVESFVRDLLDGDEEGPPAAAESVPVPSAAAESGPRPPARPQGPRR